MKTWNRAVVTLLTGEVVVHEGADWWHRNDDGSVQVRKGLFRVVAEYPGGTHINVQGGSGSAPPVEATS